MFSIIIPGEPVAKGRPRLGKHGNVYTPDKTRGWEDWLACYIVASGATLYPTNKDLEYSVDATFYLKSKRRIDGDNLLKTLLDGLNGIVWADDKQVTQVYYEVRRGEPEPRTFLIVEIRNSERA